MRRPDRGLGPRRTLPLVALALALGTGWVPGGARPAAAGQENVIDSGPSTGPEPPALWLQRAKPASANAIAIAIDPVDRARLREMLLSERSAEADQRARQSALAAYRLMRRREVGFLPAPERRGDDARAFAAALQLLRRTAGEAQTWRAELARTVAEREALEAAPERPGAGVAPDGGERTLLHPPTRGSLMAGPGVRLDQATGGQRRFTGVEYLGRLNEPVQAVEAGTVRRIEPLAQGGFAVVVAHADGLVSIVAGLRRADVQAGQAVERGQALGLTGRNLDGAPVLGFELWQAGASVDPRPFLEAPADKPHKARRRAAHPPR